MKSETQSLFGAGVGNMRAATGGAQALDDGKFGVSGVYWPAFVCKPDLTILKDDGGGTSDEGGAASGGGDDLPAGELDAFAVNVAAFLGVEDAASFRDQVRRATGGGGAADTLADRLRSEVPADGADAEAVFEHEGRDEPDTEEAISWLDSKTEAHKGVSFAPAIGLAQRFRPKDGRDLPPAAPEHPTGFVPQGPQRRWQLI